MKFISKNKHLLIFTAVQAVFWVIFFIILFTGMKQEAVHQQPWLSAIREVFIQVIVIYIYYLLIIPKIDIRKHIWRYLLATIALIVAVAGLNLLLEFVMTGDTDWLSLVWTSETSVGLLILSAPLKWSYDYFVLQHKQQEILNREMEAELKYLRLQINPHFLFNTLNNIYYLAQNKSNKTAPAISRLSELMRYLLEKKDQDKVSLQKEIDFIEAYLELEKMRVSGLDLTINKTGDLKNKWVPPMLILPLVENAFKHGIDKRIRKNRLAINMNVAEQLSLSVENSISHSFSRGQTREGTGIENLKKRLELLFPGNHSLSTEIIDSIVFQAELKIPLI